MKKIESLSGEAGQLDDGEESMMDFLWKTSNLDAKNKTRSAFMNIRNKIKCKMENIFERESIVGKPQIFQLSLIQEKGQTINISASPKTSDDQYKFSICSLFSTTSRTLSI